MADDTIDPKLVQEWAEACTEVYRVLRRGRNTVGRLGEGDTLTEAQVSVLEFIGQQGAMTVSDIARSAGLAQPTVTRMLNSLQTKGVVTRYRDPEDERKLLVELTPSGRSLWSEKRQVLLDYQQDSLEKFPAEKREEVVALFKQFAEIVNEQIGP